MLRVNCNHTARLRLWAPSVGLCDGPEQLCVLQSPTSTEDRYSEQFHPSPGHKSQIVRVILSLSRSQALALAPAGGSMGISESPSLPRALPPAFPLFRSPTLPLPRSPSLLLSLSPFLASVNPARRRLNLSTLCFLLGRGLSLHRTTDRCRPSRTLSVVSFSRSPTLHLCFSLSPFLASLHPARGRLDLSTLCFSLGRDLSLRRTTEEHAADGYCYTTGDIRAGL